MIIYYPDFVIKSNHSFEGCLLRRTSDFKVQSLTHGSVHVGQLKNYKKNHQTVYWDLCDKRSAYMVKKSFFSVLLFISFTELYIILAICWISRSYLTDVTAAKLHWHLSSEVIQLISVTDPTKRWLKAWWRHQMEKFSTLLALCVGNPSVTGEFPSQMPVTRGFDVFFDLRLKRRFSKQSRRRWFEKPSRPLWRHCKVIGYNRFFS